MKRIDIFYKTQEHSDGTLFGGLLTLLMLLIMGFFVKGELQLYFSPPHKLSFSQQQLIPQTIRTTLDITLFKVPCHIVSLDVQDQMLSHVVNIGNAKKYRIINNTVQSRDFQLYNLPVGQRIQSFTNAIKEKEGCRVKATFTLKQVPGNFHISFHGYNDLVQYARQTQMFTNPDFSYKINQLSFGNVNNIQEMQQRFPSHRFRMEQLQKELGSGVVQVFGIKLVRISGQSFLFQSQPNFVMNYQLYNFKRFMQNDGGLFFIMKIGDFNLVDKKQSEPVEDLIAWLLSVLSGIFFVFQVIQFIVHELMRKLL